MRINIVKTAQAVRDSYWFIPSLMAFFAIVLGATMVWIDSGPGDGWLDGVGWYQSVKAEGAHQVLSTIAGSMITVAGVVFSITIVAISYASSQYGPRVLTNFMSDVGNKVTLGTFIATFLYCLVVLRTIRGGDEGEFVPQMAVMVGLLLALCSICVLIYFIHHVPQTIHVNNVIALIGRQLIRDVDKRFPGFIGDEPEDGPVATGVARAAAEDLFRYGGNSKVSPVESRDTGYIQAIDEVALMEAAAKADLVLRLRYRPGDYLLAGRTLLEAWPAARVDPDIADSLRSAYSTGSRRTPFGDLGFLMNELVEIATRALSSGVNDPTTARTCLDWLGAGATEIARRRLPDSHRLDEEGKLRVIAPADDFRDYIQRAFGELRQYLGGDANAAVHALRTLGEIASACATRDQLEAIAEEAKRLGQSAGELLSGPERARVHRRVDALCALLSQSPERIVEGQAEWLGGSA
ncbi:MAG: DUF2254 domain-containing protein [Allosphingosinicella sp.]